MTDFVDMATRLRVIFVYDYKVIIDCGFCGFKVMNDCCFYGYKI